jgi:hypothetical protein
MAEVPEDEAYSGIDPPEADSLTVVLSGDPEPMGRILGPDGHVVSLVYPPSRRAPVGFRPGGA